MSAVEVVSAAGQLVLGQATFTRSTMRWSRRSEAWLLLRQMAYRRIATGQLPCARRDDGFVLVQRLRRIVERADAV